MYKILFLFQHFGEGSGKAIVEILSNKEKARKLTEEGRKRAEDFDVRKIVKIYEDVLISGWR